MHEKIQSSRKFKLAQLRVRICDLPIKRRDTDTNIKLKTVRNLAKITGRRWWLHLDPTTLIQLKTKSKLEYYSFKRSSTKIREAYLEKRARDAAK